MIAVLPVRGLPEITPGVDLAGLITASTVLEDGDVVVVASKVVAKSEGAFAPRYPREDAATARRRIALADARRVLVDTPTTVIVETAHGLVCAAAGVDASNVPGGLLLRLPADPDASAAALREALRARAAADVGVVISDTFGRPWRLGQTDVAVGAAGIVALRDEQGRPDRGGVPLSVTAVAVADEIAAAADLARRKDDGTAVVVVRGLEAAGDQTAAALRRPRADDLFPHGRGWLVLAQAGEASPGRAGPPADWEVRRVLDATPVPGVTVSWNGDVFEIVPATGFAAGRATARVEAALLDLDYRPVVTVGDTVRVQVAAPVQ